MYYKHYSAYKRFVDYFEKKGYHLGINNPENEQLKDYLRNEKWKSNNETSQGGASSCPYDRDFYMNLIATRYRSYEMDEIIPTIPLEYINEEMAMALMFATMQYYSEHYFSFHSAKEIWFYRLNKEKPEILNQDLYILAAYFFSSYIDRESGRIAFLDCVPEKYRNSEFFFALCDNARCRDIMKFIPKKVLTDDFLRSLIYSNPCNIICFTENELERNILIDSSSKKYAPCWQIAILQNIEAFEYLPLNDERIKYFLEHYSKSSSEYKLYFKSHYKKYRRQQYLKEHPQPTNRTTNDDTDMASLTNLALIFAKVNIDDAIDTPSRISRERTNTESRCRLPVHYNYTVPRVLEELLDEEEFILTVYDQLGIKVNEFDGDDLYYNIEELPEGFHISNDPDDDERYLLCDGQDNILLDFVDYGSFYDRHAYVRNINICLDLKKIKA